MKRDRMKQRSLMARQKYSWSILLITFTGLQCQSFVPPAVVETNSLTAFVGTCEEIRCKVTGDLPEEDAQLLWIKDFKWDSSDFTGTIVYSNDPRGRPVSPEFVGRVTYSGSPQLSNRNPSCSVSICGLREQDTGEYTFRYISKQQVKNKWSATTKAYIEVTANPCEITFNKPAAVQAGKTLTLTCSTPTTCPSYLKIESVPKSLKDLSTHQSSMRYTASANFKTSWTDDRAEFSCQTRENKNSQLIKKITVSVLYAPREITAKINSADVTEGQSVTLSCSAKGQPPPTFTWYKNNQWGYPVHTGAVWTINSVQGDHSGGYRCFAKNEHGSRSSNLIQIDVKYGPNVEVTSSPPPYEQGRTLSLLCNVLRSNPYPSTFTWFKNNQRVSTEQQFSKTLQPEDNGSYSCSAQNSVSTAESRPLQIQVQYKPRNTSIEIVTQFKVVVEGSSVIFKCNTDANPAPGSFDWYKNRVFNQTTTENSLDLGSVVRGHEGCYECQAANRIGSGDFSSELCITILYAPQQVRVQADPGLVLRENMTLSLRCSAQSDPPVSSVSWSREGQEGLVHTGELYTVESVSANHRGRYSCTARNQIGQATSPPADVQVKYGPKQALVLRAEEEQGSVTLSCSSHSFPDSDYTWYRSSEGQTTKVSENRNYTVQSTEPGLYFCTAKNEVSESTSQPVSLFLQGSSLKYIVLALVPLIILVCAFIVYRLKRKNSAKEGQMSSSRNGTEDVQAETNKRRDVPGVQRQRAGLTNGTSSANAVYATANLPKKDQPGTSKQPNKEDSVCYASLNFDKTKRTAPPKPSEEDVVYSTVKKPDQDDGVVYENFTKARKVKCPSFSDSSDDDDVEVNYTQVNFKAKARNRDGPGQPTTTMEEYSELKF